MSHLFGPLFDGTLAAAVPAGLATALSGWLGLVLLVAAGGLGLCLDVTRRPAGPTSTATAVGRGRAVLTALAVVLAVAAVAATFVRFALHV